MSNFPGLDYWFGELARSAIRLAFDIVVVLAAGMLDAGKVVLVMAAATRILTSVAIGVIKLLSSDVLLSLALIKGSDALLPVESEGGHHLLNQALSLLRSVLDIKIFAVCLLASHRLVFGSRFVEVPMMTIIFPS